MFSQQLIMGLNEMAKTKKAGRPAKDIERVHVSLPATLLKQARKQAEEEFRDLSSLVAASLAAYLAN